MCQMLTDSASVLKTEIFALSLFKRNCTGFLSQTLNCQQKEEFYCVCVKVCHSKLNLCSVAGLGVKLGFPVDPKKNNILAAVRNFFFQRLAPVRKFFLHFCELQWNCVVDTKIFFFFWINRKAQFYP